ncbi:MAG TPA: Ig-like domain-containing protein, partial [Candidatus Limnocylindrales bacterium]|nr:Ig-like domain-containing protein [Candidatus Limnocylindrales bacterium]
MRRLLIAVTVAFLLGGLFPVGALAGVPEAQGQSLSVDEDHDLLVELEAIDASGEAVTVFTPQQPSHGSVSETGSIVCDAQTPNTCTQEWTYSPDENFNGSDSFTFTATSEGAASAPATVSITVNAVNDDPTFTVGPNVEVDEDSGPYIGNGFITDGSPGPADESGQSLAYVVTADTTSLFSAQPAISA